LNLEEPGQPIDWLDEEGWRIAHLAVVGPLHMQRHVAGMGRGQQQQRKWERLISLRDIPIG